MSEVVLEQAYRYLLSGQANIARQLFTHLRQDPGLEADACNGLGLCEEASARLTEAENFYRRALALREEAEFVNNLAICLQTQGKIHEALSCLRRLAELKPEPEIQYNLALMLASRQAFGEALEYLCLILAGRSHLPEPLLLLLEIMNTLAYQPDCRTQLEQRLATQPDQAGLHLALAAWYELRDQPEMAVRYFRSALRCNPALLGAYRNLIHVLQEKGQFAQALTTARRLFTSELAPASIFEMIIALQQPVIYQDTQVPALRQELEALLDSFGDLSPPAEPLRLAAIPFFLTYQWGEDRLLQEKLAGFYAGFFRRFERVEAHPVRSRPRLALVSAHFYRHSVMDLLLRAAQTLLQSADFETWLCLLPLTEASRRDAVTDGLRAEADHVLELSDDIFVAMQQLRDCQLDLLVFVDVGMDAYAYALALNRLARFQLVLPGHPVTTGISTLDYFVSATALEPADPQPFYTESLVCLPGLPDYQQPLVPPPASRQELGLPEGHLYFCPMTTFKLQPSFDRLLAGICRQDPDARLVFLQFKHQLHTEIEKRFSQSYPQFAQRLIFLPWSSQEVFFQRLLAADVILDTFPFGGGNTSYQALGLGCPIVCLDVPWMKGRWTQAMYQLMGMEGLVAPSLETYARLAIQVASSNQNDQAALRQQIRERSRILFDNPTWSDALLNFCRQLTESAPR